ncbi:hypothetical protein DPM19_34605, partial [Actinomadura craniellae]
MGNKVVQLMGVLWVWAVASAVRRVVVVGWLRRSVPMAVGCLPVWGVWVWMVSLMGVVRMGWGLVSMKRWWWWLRRVWVVWWKWTGCR